MSGFFKEDGRDLLCTAVESGGYTPWFYFDKLSRTDDLDYLSVECSEVDSLDGSEGLIKVVTAEDMVVAANKLIDERLTNTTIIRELMTQNYDACSADCVLQVAMFGEVIYS